MFRTYFQVAKYAFIAGGGAAAGIAVVKAASSAFSKGADLAKLAYASRKSSGTDSTVSLDDDQTDSTETL